LYWKHWKMTTVTESGDSIATICSSILDAFDYLSSKTLDKQDEESYSIYMRATSVYLHHRHAFCTYMCIYLYVHTCTHFLRGYGDQNEQSSFLTLTLAQWFSHSLLFSLSVEFYLRLWHYIRSRKVTRGEWNSFIKNLCSRHKSRGFPIKFLDNL